MELTYYNEDEPDDDCDVDPFEKPPCYGLYDTWPGRDNVLRVSKRFHRLARPYLYENVTLQSVKSFHAFFLVDTQDWITANKGSKDTHLKSCYPDVHSLFDDERWRDYPDSIQQREIDWQCVSDASARSP